jgi:hypothetical protein
MERVARIELANIPWQGIRLPLHHTRLIGTSGRIRTLTIGFGDRCAAINTTEI